MTEQELARLLHIDEDDDLSIANAVMHQKAAEEYLAGAGVTVDYNSSLYKQAVIVLVTRSLDRPDMLTKFDDMPGSGIVAIIAQLRRHQVAESEVEHE
jgi:hypothetical protein